MHCSNALVQLTAKLLQPSFPILKQPTCVLSFQARPILSNLDLKACKFYSVQSTDEAEYEVARKWYSEFNDSTIPKKIARTTYVHSGGAGGQKVNKTASKANTVWSMKDLEAILPSIISKGLRRGTHYQQRVKHLQNSANIARLKMKKQHGDKKKSRSVRLHYIRLSEEPR
ncbi:hypothetical protein EYC84_009154 [Monilinia fructicola]|uniref:Prokaryotic-type class I peptide chain release factors domain-containing protein n=1 Tax=Monilinia fructicola TaxID=38448 RepID=A0A5M9JF98_MONFR|nr:hypothetical protein EYC84_009154 [Monilinia fructicola]